MLVLVDTVMRSTGTKGLAVNTMSIRMRVALAKTRESQQLTREVVEASLANAKAAQSLKLAALEQAVSK